ncbi:lisH domain-containing protein C16orf63 [Angomonas deanei]|uniref:Centrosomal protein 20 n=1 Tax=Angomonas deanei TaxID=59799 RepID=S9VIF2_9TRYP|nr:lisH domain-containing protein C16orf63 [Angomonas deanei]EPY40613.1 lisH domain-containing protein C16orf63 [Angomonas deanei]EPY41100.1 lisH domain-containing protein C16orf63 [Angomonas deanei]CAD2215651.1 FOP N terminal dimerisation domain/LisH, putative [Angomonas deanei]|eukprot:EPY39339.1 lisH domain-containing protein C16orf63 [Angomonas deanei]
MSHQTDSLKESLRAALEADGTVGRLKAELRAAVYHSLTDDAASGDRATLPQPPENMILNELVREYLAFNGLEHSLSVFQSEANTPNKPVPRTVLATELNLAGAPTAVPLLYSLLHECKLSRDL